MSDKNDKKIFSKENLLHTVIGIILTFIVTKFLEPVLSFLFSSFLNIGGSFIQSISDSTYRKISNGVYEQNSSYTVYLLFVVCLVALTYLFSELNSLYRSIKSNLADIEKQTKRLSNVTNGDSHKEETSSSTQEPNKFSSIEEIYKYISSKRKKYTISYTLMLLILILAYITLVFSYGKNSYVYNKALMLTNNIEIVSPYISDTEYKQLKSDFHSIENQADYNDLINRLNNIASNHSLKLKQ